MKKNLITILTLSLISIGSIQASASTKCEKILSEMPGTTAEELADSIKETASSLGISEEEVEDKLLSEMKYQDNLSKRENLSFLKRTSLMKSLSSDNNKNALYTLDAAKNVGDIFYEPSSTAFVKHGHVGIYYTNDTIIESMPKDGVRTLSRLNKKIPKGSKIFTLDGVSQDIKNKAANWSWSQIGSSYSYNFATNRNTSINGAKNCSKLVWSAYKVAGNMDIDANKGLGVYPKDILNYKLSRVYKAY